MTIDPDSDFVVHCDDDDDDSKNVDDDQFDVVVAYRNR